jgi:hypothetical protein
MRYLFEPLGELLVWTFDNVLVPIGDMGINPNSIFIVGGFIGLAYWLMRQGKYNQIAKEQGTLK